MATTTNMYRVGDYVYFETSSSSPYQIRRIEELIKTPNGNVEAKVMCFYRRRDISSSLIHLADKHQSALEEESDRESETLTEKQRHQLKHRELFLSRQIETLAATQIRGKCTVTLLNETESLSSYLSKDDTFFYTLVYDPSQKTLLADRGEIRVGSRFQAEVPQRPLEDAATTDERNLAQLEVLEYTNENELNESEIDSFLMIAKSVGTFARALDHNSTIKQPSLHMSAATASRDVTIATAMKILHKCNYNIAKAVLELVPPSGPLLCRDEMEEWSASEANLFEEAMEKYGKDFADIRQDFLPWKTVRNLVEYYYMWKTTDRHVQQKRIKAVEAESKLKQVYIPNYNSKPSNTVNGSALPPDSPNVIGRSCESCGKPSSSQWYAWGPAAHVQCRLCQSCWNYWKKFGGLKYSSKLDAEKVRNDKASSVDSMDSVGSSVGGGSTGGSGHVAIGGSGSTYPCKECGKIFNRQERLINHMVSTHPNRPHRCTISNCGKEFKIKAHLIRHCAQQHGIAIRPGSPSRPIMKTRAAFYLHTNEATKVARRVCPELFRARHFARKPFLPINSTAIKSECASRFSNGISPSDLPKITNESKSKRNRGSVVAVSHKLGTPEQECPEWLVATAKDQLPQPERLAFTPPARGEDGQFIIPRPAPPPPESVDSSDELANGNNNNGNKQNSVFGIHNINSTLIRKRPYDSNQTNGTEAATGPGATASKRRQLAPTGLLPKSSHELYGIGSLPKNALVSNGGRPKVATITRVGGGRKQMISWVDAPDDVFFIANSATKQIRRQLPPSELRKGARKPWRRVGGRHLPIGTNNGNSHTNGNSGNSTNSVRGIDMSQMV